MTLREAGQRQIRLWAARQQFDSPVEAERWQAVGVLCEQGTAGLPWLRRTLRRTQSPRVFCAAALALHRLGQTEGMDALMQAVRWRVVVSDMPQYTAELETALRKIGAPDASTALITLWNCLPYRSDQPHALAFYCRLLAQLQDPAALDILVQRVPRAPLLFQQTMQAFGEAAVPTLAAMLCEPMQERRLLAVQTLANIPGTTSADALVPFLRDPDPIVRQTIPAALMACLGLKQARRHVLAALKDGFSTREALQMLGDNEIETSLLLNLIERWRSEDGSGDTEQAVAEALHLLAYPARHSPDIVLALCELLNRRPVPRLLEAGADTLGQLAHVYPDQADRARAALPPLLTVTDGAARRAVANALLPYGDRIGLQLLRALAASWPQQGLLDRLQTLLRGGAKASLAAAQTMQQMSQWLAKVSKGAADRFLAPLELEATEPQDWAFEARLPFLLRRLLENALDELPAAAESQTLTERIALCVACIRALARCGPSVCADAQETLLRALYLVKEASIYERLPVDKSGKADLREVGAAVRLAAAETLLQTYGEQSFPLFVQTLYAMEAPVRVTALWILGRLGDARALPLLAPFVRDTSSPLCAPAQEAVAAIRRLHPEMMTLVRASSAHDSRPETLLRPAAGLPTTDAPNTLLRPTAENSVSYPGPSA